MITSERAERALDFLIETDAKLAKLEGALRDAETRAEIAKEISFLEATGANIKEKEAKASTSPRYLAAESEVTQAEIEFKTMKYQRQTADTLIGMYRTSEASRRQG